MGLRQGGLAVGVALGALIPLAAGAALVLTSAGESPLESAADTAPLLGSIEQAERRGDANVAIAVEYADAASPATQASGTITSLPLTDGATVATGTPVMQVNAQDVLAYTAESPLYRDIVRGQEGDDVRTAQRLLEAWGFNPGPIDGKAGWRTERAITAFNTAHGYGDKNPVFSLAALVWVGVAPVTIDELSVRLGDQVSPGTALFTTTAGLASVAVTETPGMPQDAALELQVAEVVVPYEAGTARVTDPEAVAAIADALGTVTEGVATVRRAEPVIVATVPSSAVVTDESGRACLFASVDGPPVPVTPLGGSLGTIDLDLSLVGEPVLLNPREVREDLTCGS